MKIRFEAAVQAPAGTLSREERAEIREYIESQQTEAAGTEKALRLLIRKLQGKLVKLEDPAAVFTLPDYGSACKVKVKAYEEDKA